MYLLGLDFETTGLSTEDDLITEVGAVLWDVDRQVPATIDNFYLNWQGHRPDFMLSEEVSKKTGITEDNLQRFGLDPFAGFFTLDRIMAHACAVVAHNGTLFDQPMFNSWSRHLRASSPGCLLPSDRGLLWIDSQVDVDYPEEVTTRKLTYLAAEHGFLNPWAHRAVFDVLTMMKMMSGYDLETVIWSANQPTVLLQAVVSYDEKDLAKERSFRWDADKKRWAKTVKMHKLDQETAGLPFKTRVLPLS